jgi:hypothetical protein
MALGLANEVNLPENTQARDGLRRVQGAEAHIPRTCLRTCKGCPTSAGRT